MDKAKKTVRLDTSQRQACKKEEGTGKALAILLPRMVRSQTRDSRSFRVVGAKNKNLKEGVVLLNILSVAVNGTEAISA